MKKFKVGDLIRIKDGTHDPNMPDSRCGMLLERGTMHQMPRVPPNDADRLRPEPIWNVFMTNGAELRFHEMFLEHITEEDLEKEQQRKKQ